MDIRAIVAWGVPAGDPDGDYWIAAWAQACADGQELFTQLADCRAECERLKGELAVEWNLKCQFAAKLAAVRKALE